MDSSNDLTWRKHFGSDAADVIAIACHWGGFNLQAVLLRCFKHSKSERISMPTVEAVLQELSDEWKAEDARLQALLPENLRSDWKTV